MIRLRIESSLKLIHAARGSRDGPMVAIGRAPRTPSRSRASWPLETLVVDNGF